VPPSWSKIATDEIEETIEDDGKDPAAKALGKKGGAARAKGMSSERRAEIAQTAAASQFPRLLGKDTVQLNTKSQIQMR